MEDLLAADARPFKGKTDYEDYVRRIAKEARERALRLMIDDEAEETDDESEEELVDDEAPRTLEEFIEEESEEEESDADSMEVQIGEEDEDNLDYWEKGKELFGSDWEDDN